MVFGFGNKKQHAEAKLTSKQETQEQPKQGILSSLRDKLGRTRSSIAGGLAALLSGRGKIDDELLEELETLLITADVGIDASMRIINDISTQVKRKTLSDPEALQGVLKAELLQILQQANSKEKQPAHGKPRVILMVGINGAGKTTTIGKLTRRFQNSGQRVMLAAGDTFRAAAVEQLQAWGERNDVSVIAQHTGADSASVIYDALEAATARGVDVLIADTAGRLHTKSNLMDELVKIVRVMKKIDTDAPHEVMLVVDGGTGQNALQQAIHFNRAVSLSGITITKLDGTAKGGILFAIADKLQIPIRYIGVGEGIDDLRPFDAAQFVDALFEP
jgi:fused signal recognition particle receptor